MSAQRETPAEPTPLRCLQGEGQDRRTAIMKVTPRTGRSAARLYLLTVRPKPAAEAA